MRTKVTLVLIFLNVALFFYIFSFKGGILRDEKILEGQIRVLDASVANVRSIEVTGGTDLIRLERVGDRWMLKSPVEWPANPHAVERIRNELLLLKIEAKFTRAQLEQNQQSLAEYGLDKPALTIRYTVAPANDEPAPPPVVLKIGNESPVGNRLYILSPDGQSVYVVSRSLADSVRLPIDQLRDDALFSIPSFEAKSLSVQAAKTGNLRVNLRHELNRWFLETPIRTRANKNATEIAINNLNKLTALSFPPPTALDSGRTGLSNPLLRIWLEGTNRREILLVGAAVKDATTAAGETVYYGKLDDRPAVFTTSIPNDLLETLGDAQQKLRDRRVLDLEGRSITAIRLRAPGQSEVITLQKLESSGTGPETGTWQLVRTESPTSGPQTLPADPAAVERLIARLTYLEAYRKSSDSVDGGFTSDAPSVADLEKFGFTHPEREVDLTVSSPDPQKPGGTITSTIRLQIGAPNHVYARVLNQDFIYQIDPAVLQELSVVSNVYRDKRLRELPAGARIRGLNLVKLAGNTTLYARQLGENETWEMVLAAEPADRRKAVEELLTQLRVLKAKQIQRDTYAPTFQLGGEEQAWAYELVVSIDLVGGTAGQPQIMRLLFSERTGGGTQLVGSPNPGYEAIFTAEQPLIDALWKLIYGPRDPGPPP